MLAVVLAITLTMIITRRDTAFTAVILWALAGIAVKFAAIPSVMIPTWITFGVIALGLAIVLVWRKPDQQKL
jgi:hypothetical protein